MSCPIACGNPLLIKQHTNRQAVRSTPIAGHTGPRIGNTQWGGWEQTNRYRYTKSARDTNVLEASPNGFRSAHAPGDRGPHPRSRLSPGSPVVRWVPRHTATYHSRRQAVSMSCPIACGKPLLIKQHTNRQAVRSTPYMRNSCRRTQPAEPPVYGAPRRVGARRLDGRSRSTTADG